MNKHEQRWRLPVGERSRSVVDSEPRLWALTDAVVNSISLPTRSHSDRLNATVPCCGHMLQLLSDSSRGTHLAGVMAWLLQRSASACVSSPAVCIVSVNEKGTRRLLLIGTAITDTGDVLPWFVAMALLRPGRCVNGKRTEYLGHTVKVFVDAISMESNISYSTISVLRSFTTIRHIHGNTHAVLEGNAKFSKWDRQNFSLPRSLPNHWTNLMPFQTYHYVLPGSRCSKFNLNRFSRCCSVHVWKKLDLVRVFIVNISLYLFFASAIGHILGRLWRLIAQTISAFWGSWWDSSPLRG